MLGACAGARAPAAPQPDPHAEAKQAFGVRIGALRGLSVLDAMRSLGPPTGSAIGPSGALVLKWERGPAGPVHPRTHCTVTLVVVDEAVKEVIGGGNMMLCRSAFAPSA